MAAVRQMQDRLRSYLIAVRDGCDGVCPSLAPSPPSGWVPLAIACHSRPKCGDSAQQEEDHEFLVCLPVKSIIEKAAREYETAGMRPSQSQLSAFAVTQKQLLEAWQGGVRERELYVSPTHAVLASVFSFSPCECSKEETARRRRCCRLAFDSNLKLLVILVTQTLASTIMPEKFTELLQLLWSVAEADTETETQQDRSARDACQNAVSTILRYAEVNGNDVVQGWAEKSKLTITAVTGKEVRAERDVQADAVTQWTTPAIDATVCSSFRGLKTRELSPKKAAMRIAALLRASLPPDVHEWALRKVQVHLAFFSMRHEGLGKALVLQLLLVMPLEQSRKLTMDIDPQVAAIASRCDQPEPSPSRYVQQCVASGNGQEARGALPASSPLSSVHFFGMTSEEFFSAFREGRASPAVLRRLLSDVTALEVTQCASKLFSTVKEGLQEHFDDGSDRCEVAHVLASLPTRRLRSLLSLVAGDYLEHCPSADRSSLLCLLSAMLAACTVKAEKLVAEALPSPVADWSSDDHQEAGLWDVYMLQLEIWMSLLCLCNTGDTATGVRLYLPLAVACLTRILADAAVSLPLLWIIRGSLSYTVATLGHMYRRALEAKAEWKTEGQQADYLGLLAALIDTCVVSAPAEVLLCEVDLLQMSSVFEQVPCTRARKRMASLRDAMLRHE